MEIKKDSINYVMWGDNGNWGDWLNPYLISKISGVNVGVDYSKHRVWLGDTESNHRYYCIGTILDNTYSTNYEVWGSGLESNVSSLGAPPKMIHAVRGPLTRKQITRQGYECPEVYGDPALLLPRFYMPKVKKEYKYGVIAHFSHLNHPWLNKLRNNPNVNIINVLDPTIINFVDEINKCEIILSSALHGLICADSYNIPSFWINLSPHGGYNWFKFYDYFASVGRPFVIPIDIYSNTKLGDFWPYLYNYFIDIDLDKLLEVCPFNKAK